MEVKFILHGGFPNQQGGISWAELEMFNSVEDAIASIKYKKNHIYPLALHAGCKVYKVIKRTYTDEVILEG